MKASYITCHVFVAAIAAVIVSTPAQAEETGKPAIFRKGATLMSLFTGESQDEANTRQAYIGDAPWICSPSGYGHIASCVPRATVASAD